MSGVPPTRPTPSRLTLFVIVAPLVALTVAAYVGDAIAPTLVDRHPLLLIALNARNRNLALTTNYIDAIPYYLVGTLRLLASDPLFYLLGWFYGDAAVKWAERNTRTMGDMLRWVEQRFKRFAIPLVFAFPNNFICLFAGAAGMGPVVFLVANISGTLVRLYIIRALGATFSGPIDWVLEFIAEYRMPLLAISIALVAFTIFNERKKGSGELTGLTHLPEDMDKAGEDEVISDPEPPMSNPSPRQTEHDPDAGSSPELGDDSDQR